MSGCRARSHPDLLAGDGPPNALQRVVVPVNDAFLELDDGVVGDLDAGWTNFRAAPGDVAVLHTEFLADFRDAVLKVQRVHLVLREANQFRGPAKASNS